MGVALGFIALFSFILFAVLWWYMRPAASDFGMALLQVALIWCVSNLPIFWVLVDQLLAPDGKITAQDLFRYSESLVYIAAILGPVFVMLLLKLKDKARYYILLNMFIILLCLFFAAQIYSRERYGTPINQEHLALLATTLYGLSIGVWYLSLVYERAISNPTHPGDSSTARAKRIEERLP